MRYDLLLPHWIPARCEYDVKLFERAFFRFHEEEVDDWYEDGVEGYENAAGKRGLLAFSFSLDVLAPAVSLVLTCTFSSQGSPLRAG